MLKPCGEAGPNLLCKALVRAELHLLTVQRRKSLFMLMHQESQASVSKRRSFASLRELIVHTELPSWHTVPPSIFTSTGKIREISLFPILQRPRPPPVYKKTLRRSFLSRREHHCCCSEGWYFSLTEAALFVWKMGGILSFLSFSSLARSCPFTLIEGSLISSYWLGR